MKLFQKGLLSFPETRRFHTTSSINNVIYIPRLSATFSVLKLSLSLPLSTYSREARVSEMYQGSIYTHVYIYTNILPVAFSMCTIHKGMGFMNIKLHLLSHLPIYPSSLLGDTSWLFINANIIGNFLTLLGAILLSIIKVFLLVRHTERNSRVKSNGF